MRACMHACCTDLTSFAFQQPSVENSQAPKMNTQLPSSSKCAGSMAYMDSKMDAALDYSWILPLGELTAWKVSLSLRSIQCMVILVCMLQMRCILSTLAHWAHSWMVGPVHVALPAVVPATTASPLYPPAAPQETYSQKVFVGGLPPDIDQGKKKLALFNNN